MKNFDEWNVIKQKLDKVHKPPFFNEREVWWCSIGVNIGYEIYGKGAIFTRPVVIVSKLSKATFMGVPLTSKRKEKPYHVPIHFNQMDGCALIGQVKAMDSKRLAQRMGTMNEQQFDIIRSAIKAMF